MDGKMLHQILACKNLRMLEIKQQQLLLSTTCPQQNFRIKKKKKSQMMYLIHFLGINFSFLFSFMLKESSLVKEIKSQFCLMSWFYGWKFFPSRSSLQNPRVLKLSNNPISPKKFFLAQNKLLT